MSGFGKGIRLTRLVGGLVIVSLLLVACGSGENPATPTAQDVVATTGSKQTQTQTSANPPTIPANQTTVSPFSTVPVYSGLTQGKLKEMYPVLAGLAEAKSFKINDDWNGLSTDAPRIAHFTLTRKANQFDSKAFYSIGGFNWIGGMDNLYFEASVALTISLDVSQKFLQMLADAPVELGPAKGPFVTAAVDSYPSLYMNIDTGFGSFEFNSLSNNMFLINTFIFAGHEFNGLDRSAFDAFDLLKPYLRSDVQKSLYKQPTLTSGKSTPMPSITPGSELTPTVK